MRLKKSIIIALFLLCVLMISAVNAASDNNDTIISSDVKDDYISNQDDDINDKTDVTILNEKKETYKVSINEINDEKISYAANDVLTDTEASFTDLDNEMKDKNKVDLSQDYKFNNGTDTGYKDGIVISKDNFVLNGNGRTIDGNNQSRIFNITGNNVILNNLILSGGNADKGGAIYATGTLTLNNITFINNYATKQGGAVGFYSDVNITCDNSRFIDNYAEAGSSIFVDKGNLNLYNTNMTSKVYVKRSQIILKEAAGYVENSTFFNIVSAYDPAIHLEKSRALTVISSKFINLTANITAGAIGVKQGGAIYIKNCEFINTTSIKNAGAIIADIAGNNGITGNVTIFNTTFKDSSSEFGGAYIQFGGKLLINNSEFINNHATYNGGSIYISYVDYGEINNCNFTSNGVDIIEGYPTYGGAIFCDMSTLTIDSSKFINNTATAGSAIYTYDSSYNIKNSLFENNKNPIYSLFDKKSFLENNTYINDDDVSTNNTFYATFQIGEGLLLTLSNNTINVDTLPSRFDLRDWGWVSPIRDQGWMGSCWTFGMTGVLESALLKATNITTDFSENNMQNTMLRYSIYGSPALEGGFNIISTGYLLSWFGAFTQDADTYDELGKISPLITTTKDIHIQDVMFTSNNEVPNGTQLKWAILKYGSIDVTYNGQSTYDDKTPYYNPDTYAQYVNDSSVQPNHGVSIVGWNDNFPKEKFGITPPGDGAWIVKNSWGTDWGDNGFLYVSYYDKTLLQSIDVSSYATSIIIENTVPYNKNYQYDMFWGGEFESNNGTVSYYNLFEALDDDLIAGVGTYFNQSGINYKVEIFVNDELKLSQTGISPYYGYHTIKLNDYIPIKKGDVFKAVITSNAMPKLDLTDTRVHYTENITFICLDGQCIDCYNLGCIACLKVYTVADDSKIINNKDVVVDYGSESYFSVQVVTADGHSVGAGAVINFNINGKTTTTLTDSNGIAKIKITEAPGNYIITTTYKNQTYKNNINIINTTNKPTDKPTTNPSTKITKTATKITAKKATYKSITKTKKYTITLKTGKKPIKKATVKITIKGKKYKKTIKTTTNNKGKATFKIKKLTRKGKYTATITYKGTKKYKASKKTVKIIIK